MSDTTAITLNLSGGSIKKLRALAILTGMPIADVEQQLSAIFDTMLSDRIHALVQEIDGVESPVDYALTQNGVQPESPSVQALDGGEEAHEEVEQQETAHTLSDDDEGTVVADDPEMAQMIAEALPPRPAMRDVGENAEAFLDASMASAAQSFPQERARPAARAFDPRRPRVKISDYGGEE